MYSYKNGNALISIYNDGTRIVEFENKLNLEYPLNIDIRVSTQCSFGQKEDGSSGFCTFCHESAKTNGKECDYEVLKKKLENLPSGIELAIGGNNITESLILFLTWCYHKGFICNLTVNQGHLNKYQKELRLLINNGLIKGLGVSYRKPLKWDIPNFILNYENTVFHVIAGIDNIEDIISLSKKGVNKVLILGEKDFGYNLGKVNLESKNHKHWRWYLMSILKSFNIVSFDNLALEYLKPQRYMSESSFLTFNQGEHSMYINAVEGYYSPSSRSNIKTSWGNIDLKDFFINKENTIDNL
jgi:hypothetical protein